MTLKDALPYYLKAQLLWHLFAVFMFLLVSLIGWDIQGGFTIKDVKMCFWISNIGQFAIHGAGGMALLAMKLFPSDEDDEA